MSERLSSVEIEDVLSSIRRLVSEDLRPGAKAAEQAAPVPDAAPPVAEVGKLVLTPAHRIQTDPAEATAGFSSIRGRAAVTPAYEEDAEVPQAEPDRGHDWFDFAAPDQGEGQAAARAAEAAPVAEEEGTAEPDPLPMAEPDTAESEVAGWSMAPDAAEETSEDVLSGPATAAEEADWLPEQDPVEPAPAEAVEEAPMPDVLEPEDRAAKPEVHEDWADAAEAEIRRELEQEAEASAFARFDAADEVRGPDGPLFDEEMLRDLVRDIIREELQGALGERITRNVRKLVRAEIARALAVRDFE